MYNMALFEGFRLPNIYEGDYKKLILIPIILLIISLFFALQVKPGIDLKGGVLITMIVDGKINESDEVTIKSTLEGLGKRDYNLRVYQSPAGQVVEIEMITDERIAEIDEKIEMIILLSREIGEIESTLARLRTEYNIKPTSEIENKIIEKESELDEKIGSIKENVERIEEIGKIIGLEIGSVNLENMDTTKLIDRANKLALDAKSFHRNDIVNKLGNVIHVSSYSFEEVSSTLSKLFINKIIEIGVISAILVIIVVFIVFRIFVPSLAVLIGAASDIVFALGAMGLFGIPLTLPSFAAIMMLVGLSLDTDMMLTIKAIKHIEETPKKRVYNAMKTGFAMTTTTMTAFIVLLALGLITKIPVYFQIGAVAVAGMIGDLIATWGLNAVIVLWFLERKAKETKW